MIKLEHFSKVYNSSKSFAVDNISFEVPKGSVTALLGPNGSGKSTIIKAICGFHFPTKGIVYTDNPNQSSELINLNDNPELAMKYIGYVPEKSMLPSDMYVYNFLDYAAKIHGLKSEEKQAAIQNVVKECELESILSKKIKTLSKGFQQRVSFAQALIHNPPNLVLDEPITGLDPKQIHQMRNLIKKLSAQKSILLSTHIFQEVTSLCDNILIINDGKLIAQGSEGKIIADTRTTSLDEAFIKLTDTPINEKVEE